MLRRSELWNTTKLSRSVEAVEFVETTECVEAVQRRGLLNTQVGR